MIPYNYADDMIVATHRDLLITDGTVTVSGTGYSVSGDTVTITNEYLEQESFELHQSLCSVDQLQFGSCESSSVSFTIHDNIPTLKGKTIKVYMIPDSDASKMLQIGVYKVEEDKLSADRTKRQITAYDALYDILNADVAAWYNSLLPTKNDTVTLAEMRFAFTAYFGLTQETISLPNDSMVVRRTIEPESLSGADVIRAICELEGCFGQISNEGKFRYVVLSPGLDDGLFPSDTLYPADDLYPQDVNHDVDVIPRAGYLDVQFEDYNVESITGLTIRTDDSDVGVTVGTTENLYIITANPLVYGKSGTELTTIATNVFGNMENRYYKPCTLEAIGNPLHEVGDGIRIRTTYRGIVTYILERKLVGIQALRDTYTANGDQKTNQQLNSTASKFKQLENKTAKIEADTDGVRIYVTDQLDKTKVGSYAYLTEQEIGLRVERDDLVSDLNTKIGSGITIGVNSIAIQSSGEFTVNATNFKLDADGNAELTGAELDSCIVYDSLEVRGSIDMGTVLSFDYNNDELTMFDGAIYVDSNDYLCIDGNAGNSAQHVAINGHNVHIGYQSTDVRIYECYVLSGTQNANSGPRIRFDGAYSTSIFGPYSAIKLDPQSSSYGIVLDGSCNIGNGPSNDIRIKNRNVTWKQLQNVQPTDYVLVEE